MRQRTYPGTNIPVTSPFFRYKCENGHQDLLTTPRDLCPSYCGKITKCVPANEWDPEDKKIAHP